MLVISTDAGDSLPAKDIRAEILNSSLGKYSEVTLCIRFLNYHFSIHSDSWPYQTLISYGKDDVLSSFIAMSCDEFFIGCTQKYIERFSKLDIQWIWGKVFGFLFDSQNNYYVVWWPGVWNSACISGNPTMSYRLNINGHLVLEQRDSRPATDDLVTRVISTDSYLKSSTHSSRTLS